MIRLSVGANNELANQLVQSLNVIKNPEIPSYMINESSKELEINDITCMYVCYLSGNDRSSSIWPKTLHHGQVSHVDSHGNQLKSQYGQC